MFKAAITNIENQSNISQLKVYLETEISWNIVLIFYIYDDYQERIKERDSTEP